MFTGIIETLGIIKDLKKDNSNLTITVSSSITHELKIDQSVAHNGVCLTVIAINNGEYKVTAIKETIEKTNLADWKVGDILNLERAIPEFVNQLKKPMEVGILLLNMTVI